MKYIFITGTDTNCGKTYTTCQLLAYLARHNKKAIALKPIASGCEIINGQLINTDIEQIKLYNHYVVEIGCWKFIEPIAPHIAAKINHTYISMQNLIDFCFNKKYIKNLDYILIEGAGGLLVPINDKYTWLDFIIKTQIETLLVIGMQLGCINHALLTDQVLTHNKIRCIGWVANCLSPNMAVYEENINTLKSLMNMLYLTTINYADTISLFPL